MNTKEPTMSLRCPTCGKGLLIRRDDEQRVLRTRILIFNNGSCFSKCPFCKSKVAVPIRLADAPDELQKQEAAQERQGQGISLGQLLHDLKQPVAPLAAYVQTMLNNGGGESSPTEIKELNECMVHVRRLGNLIERYLGNSRFDTADDNGGRQPRRRSKHKDKSMTALGGKSVLVIDGDERVREFFRLSLGMAGADVTCAGACEEGLELARTRGFDAVLVEIVMPALTGLVRLLEAIGNKRCGTVIYVMTKEALERHVDMCMRLGANGVIDKSVSLEDVAILLQKALKGEVAYAPLETRETAEEKGA
jgi:CheY-like chemotaxis protein